MLSESVGSFIFSHYTDMKDLCFSKLNIIFMMRK